jgi:TolB-like protein/DNA-binding winged helix-turn-helix (wHTH) protein
MLRIGAWRVNPATGEISRDGETARLDARAMRLLMCLADRPGEVVSIDHLLEHVWSGVIVTPDSVYQAVASLRRQLGDDPKRPAYIATVPRMGYRMVATVGPWTDEPVAAASSTSRRVAGGFFWTAGALGVALVTAALLFTIAGSRNRTASGVATPPLEKSIAVLPIQDRTEKMSEEEFADGITEEVIDRLNKIPGLRVPPPTSSFYFKNKRRSVAEIAKALNVTYVLDGSTRKSGDRLRVAARLIRADSGVVVWSETYDRPWGDILTVQDDIAGEVTKALKTSIASDGRR